MKKLLLSLSSILMVQTSSAAVNVILTPVGGGVFNINTNASTFIGTVTISGSSVFNAASPVVGVGTGTTGSDSIAWGARAGVTTFTFAFLGNWALDSAQFGTAGGLGNIGENTNRQRPVGYAASFSGTVTDPTPANTLTLNNTVSNGGPALPAFPATTRSVCRERFVHRCECQRRVPHPIRHRTRKCPDHFHLRLE